MQNNNRVRKQTLGKMLDDDLQTHHVYFTLKLCENVRFHVASTLNTRAVFEYALLNPKERNRKPNVKANMLRQCYYCTSNKLEHFNS